MLGVELSHWPHSAMAGGAALTASWLVRLGAVAADDTDSAPSVAGGGSGTAWTDRATSAGPWRGSARSRDWLEHQRQLCCSGNWSGYRRSSAAGHRRSLHVCSVSSNLVRAYVVVNCVRQVRNTAGLPRQSADCTGPTLTETDAYPPIPLSPPCGGRCHGVAGGGQLATTR